jgi:hypothetical protein
MGELSVRSMAILAVMMGVMLLLVACATIDAVSQKRQEGQVELTPPPVSCDSSETPQVLTI